MLVNIDKSYQYSILNTWKIYLFTFEEDCYQGYHIVYNLRLP